MPEPERSRVVVVDDDLSMCEFLDAELRSAGYACEHRTSADLAYDLVLRSEVDVVVTDLKMRGQSGLALAARLAESRPEVPVIVITAFGSLETAIATIRAGAFDFLTKPFATEQLVLAVERAVKQRELGKQVKRLQGMVADGRRFDRILGDSPPMHALFDLLRRVATADAPVLISGESGTGKELVARAIHERSRRAKGPFVAINCAALPEALLESELFGHARGAFTDAKVAKVGLFVEASGGTLFLDEIGEMPLAMQPKLLRALETRSVRPVGGKEEVPFDVNLVAATNRDLESAVAEQRFRGDLYYRIDVVHVHLPPLRARGSDVLLLAQNFLERFASKSGKPITRMSSAVAGKLLAYPWPGNVRELQNSIERAVALAEYDELSASDLPERVRDYKSSHVLVAADDPSELVPMEVVERRYVLRVMEAVGGNKSEAARVLGYDRKTLYRRLEQYGVATQPEAAEA